MGYRIYEVFIDVLFGPFFKEMPIAALLSEMFPAGKARFMKALLHREALGNKEQSESSSQSEGQNEDDDDFELFVEEEDALSTGPVPILKGDDDEYSTDSWLAGDDEKILMMPDDGETEVPGAEETEVPDAADKYWVLDSYNPSGNKLRFRRNRILKSEIDPLLDILNSNPVYDLDDDDDSVINISE